MDTLPDRVGHLCALAGASRAELSSLGGLSRAHVGMILRGDVENPRSDTLTSLADVFGVSIDWLLSGRGDAPSEADVRAAVERARERRAASGAEDAA